MSVAGVIQRPLPDSPVARLRPRTVGQLIDGGFEVMRYRFAQCVTLTAIAGVPLLAVPSVAAIIWFPRRGTGTAFSQLGGDGGGSEATILLWLVSIAGSSLAIAVAGVWHTRLVMAWTRGEDSSVREVLRGTWGRVAVVALTWVILAVPRTIGLGCLTLLINPLFTVVSPVVAAEGLGPWASIRRATRIGGRRYGQFLGMFVLLVVVNMVVGYGASMVGLLVGAAFDDDKVSAIASGSVGVVLTLLMMSVQAGIAALAYIDALVRTEGLDIELEARTLFDRVGP